MNLPFHPHGRVFFWGMCRLGKYGAGQINTLTLEGHPEYGDLPSSWNRTFL